MSKMLANIISQGFRSWYCWYNLV